MDPAGQLGSDFFKESLASVSTQGPFMQNVAHRQACTELAASALNCLPALFLPSEPAFIKEFLESYFNQQD